MTGQASARAIEAAAAELRRINGGPMAMGQGEPGAGAFANAALRAAHDPALGQERSVCLRNVIATLRLMDPSANGWGRNAAEHIEDAFTARASSSPEGGAGDA